MLQRLVQCLRKVTASDNQTIQPLITLCVLIVTTLCIVVVYTSALAICTQTVNSRVGLPALTNPLEHAMQARISKKVKIFIDYNAKGARYVELLRDYVLKIVVMDNWRSLTYKVCNKSRGKMVRPNERIERGI